MTTTQEQTFTGYKLAKEVNKVLAAEGLKTIQPQLVYRYFNQKLIPFEVVNGQRVVTLSDAQAWITKYVGKRMNKAAEAFVTQGEDPEEEVLAVEGEDETDEV